MCVRVKAHKYIMSGMNNLDRYLPFQEVSETWILLSSEVAWGG